MVECPFDATLGMAMDRQATAPERAGIRSVGLRSVWWQAVHSLSIWTDFGGHRYLELSRKFGKFGIMNKLGQSHAQE